MRVILQQVLISKLPANKISQHALSEIDVSSRELHMNIIMHLPCGSYMKVFICQGHEIIG